MSSRSPTFLAVAVTLALGIFVGPSCLSMRKATVEERLLALDKNAPLRGRIETLDAARNARRRRARRTIPLLPGG